MDEPIEMTGDLTALDDEELQELAHRLVDEMARRLTLDRVGAEEEKDYPDQSTVDTAEKKIHLAYHDLDLVESGAQCIFLRGTYGAGSLRGYKLVTQEGVTSFVVVSHHSERLKNLITPAAVDSTCERLCVSDIADITQVWVRTSS